LGFLGVFFYKYFGSNSGFSIKPDQFKTRLKPVLNPFQFKKPYLIPYYINGVGRGGLFGVGRDGYPRVSGLLPPLLKNTIWLVRVSGRMFNVWTDLGFYRGLKGHHMFDERSS
jgi:hypothetical protein